MSDCTFYELSCEARDCCECPFYEEEEEEIIPANEWWYFTFGCGQEHAGHYVKIKGSYSEAREKMFDAYGSKWAFQYSEEEWDNTINDPQRTWEMETLLEVIE